MPHAAGLRGRYPERYHIGGRKLHDVNILGLLIPETGAFYAWIVTALTFNVCIDCIRTGAILCEARRKYERTT